MKDKVLIDTSVWVEFFRGRDTGIVEKVSVLLKTGRAVYTGIIALELLNGAKGPKDLEILFDAFDAMHRVDEKSTTCFNAGRAGYDLARKGFAAGTVDLLIASIAVENGLPLLTLDKHFETISAHTKLRISK